MERKIAVLHQMKGPLDNDYTLFDSGKVLHEFDRHTYPGGQNLKEELTVAELSIELRERLLSSASSDDYELAKRLLEID